MEWEGPKDKCGSALALTALSHSRGLVSVGAGALQLCVHLSDTLCLQLHLAATCPLNLDAWWPWGPCRQNEQGYTRFWVAFLAPLLLVPYSCS